MHAEDGIRDATVTGVQTVALFFQAEDGIRDATVTGVQTCALPILGRATRWERSASVRPRSVSGARASTIPKAFATVTEILRRSAPSGGRPRLPARLSRGWLGTINQVGGPGPSYGRAEKGHRTRIFGTTFHIVAQALRKSTPAGCLTARSPRVQDLVSPANRERRSILCPGRTGGREP